MIKTISMATSACFNQSTQSLSPPLSALKISAACSPPEAHTEGGKLEDHRGVSLCSQLERLRACGLVADGPRAVVLGWAGLCARAWGPSLQPGAGVGPLPLPPDLRPAPVSCGAQTAAQTHILAVRSQCWLYRRKSRAVPWARLFPAGGTQRASVVIIIAAADTAAVCRFERLSLQTLISAGWLLNCGGD